MESDGNFILTSLYPVIGVIYPNCCVAMENPSSNNPPKKVDGQNAGKKGGQQQTHKNAQRTGNRSNRSIIFVPSTSTSVSYQRKLFVCCIC